MTYTIKTGPQRTDSVLGVVVVSVDPGANPPIAVCRDNVGREISVRIDMQRGKGSLPRQGERWIIDQAMGFWTFACYSSGDPSGAESAGDLSAVTGLPEALGEHKESLDNAESRLDEMWSQGTVTAVPTATSADVTLLDGTVATACQTVSAYAPVVGDLVWTARSDGAGSRVVLGPVSSTGTNLAAGNLTLGDYGLQTNRVSNWWLKLIADARVTPTPGFPTPGISMLFANSNGIATNGARLDFVQAGSASNPTVLMKNDSHDTGLLLGDRCWYVTEADGVTRAQLWASAFGASDGSGIAMGAMPDGNPTVVMGNRNVAMVGGNDGSIYFTNGNNSARCAIRASDVWAGLGIRAETGISTGGVLVVDGQTTFNGGVVGNFGGLFRGAPLRSTSFTCGDYNPALNQILTFDETVYNNLAVPNGTIFYRGGTLPASERVLKEHIEDLGNPWPVLEVLVPARWRWSDPEGMDDRTHVGIYVDELAEVEPDAVFTLPSMPLDAAGLDEDGKPNVLPAIRWNSNNGRTYEDRAVIAYLVRAVTDLNARLRRYEGPASDAESAA